MKVIAIDFDGIINDKDDNPIISNVGKVNKVFEDRDNFIVIYTARSRSIYHSTYNLLVSHGVRFHALVMEKMRADFYIDDRSTRL
jgi:hypothetical protein